MSSELHQVGSEYRAVAKGDGLRVVGGLRREVLNKRRCDGLSAAVQHLDDGICGVRRLIDDTLKVCIRRRVAANPVLVEILRFVAHNEVAETLGSCVIHQRRHVLPHGGAARRRRIAV